MVRPSRVAGAPIHLECKYWKTIQMPQTDGVPCHMVIGQVVGVHISDEIIDDDGLVDVLRFEPVARLGYRQYTSIKNVFEIQFPKA